jgi:folate-binding protein YgfZ
MKFAPNATFYSWRPAAWLRVSGSDALIYLQGQFTNDLRKPVSRDGVYGLWLNQKGKVVADSFVLPDAMGEGFWVGSYFCPATVLRERLESCLIADEVTVDDATVEWSAVTVFGATDREALKAKVPHGRVFSGRRDQAEHLEWVFPSAARSEVMACLAGLRELTDAEIQLRRIRAGIPAIPADIGPGELPNEGGLDAVAISYTKGCYLGQEVMARLKTMGQVRRRLQRVAWAGPVPPLPAALYVGGRQIGELRSAVATENGGEGLALLTLLNLPANVALSLAPDAPPTVRRLDPS